MEDESKLRSIAEAACHAAVLAGAECAEVSVSVGRSLSVELEASAVKSCDDVNASGISVRAIFRGGVGWFSCDGLSIDFAASAGRRAAALARLSEPDPAFVSLPAPTYSYPEVDGLFDPQLEEMGIDELVRVAIENIDSAHAVRRDAIVGGGFSVSTSRACLVNSLGVCAESQRSSIGGNAFVIVRDGEDVGSFYDFDAARVMNDFEPEGLGARATKQAIKFLGAKKIDTGTMPVIFGPLASDFIFAGIAANCDADSIQHGRSFMAGKLGDQIASELVTIVDDPLISRGLRSRRCDAEGFPSRRLSIVENGVLMSYLYSSYTAGKEGVANTGHGSRGPGASPTNIVPKLGSKTADQIIRETSRGIYINMGHIRPDSTTGDISCAVDFGFAIEDGELAYAVQSSMLGGSFLDMIKQVDAVSSDCREEPGMIMPTVRIQNVLVAGGK